MSRKGQDLRRTRLSVSSVKVRRGGGDVGGNHETDEISGLTQKILDEPFVNKRLKTRGEDSHEGEVGPKDGSRLRTEWMTDRK